MDKNLDNIKELIRRGSSTARAGFTNEDDVVKKFNNWGEDKDAQDWLKIMDYDLGKIEKVEAIRITGSHKTDVQVKIKIYLRNAIAAENISVKLVSNNTGGNQVDKRWVDKYAELWNIPETIVKSLKLFTGEKRSKRRGLKDPRKIFINEMSRSEQEDIINFFENNKLLIVVDIFKGRDKFPATWMLIYIKAKNLWTLLPMSVIMNFYGNGKVYISKKGNLKIGEITMQRKGGDRGRPTANMLQFKISPTKIINQIVKIKK